MTQNESCKDLATKRELEIVDKALRSGLDGKLAKSEKQAIINTSANLAGQLVQSAALVQSAKILTNSKNIQTFGVRSTTALSNAGIANTKALAASQAAKKASFEALYAQSRAAAARNIGQSALSKATSAIGTIGGILSIISTLATATQLAILTKQVSDMRKRQAKFEADTNKEISFLRTRANSAFNMAEGARISANANQGRLNLLEKDINSVKAQVAKANRQIEQTKKEIIAANNRFDSLGGDIAVVNQRVNQANQNASKIDNSKINNLNNTVDRLQNTNIQTLQKIGDLEKQVAAAETTAKKQDEKIAELEKQVEPKEVKELITRTRNLNDKVTVINNDITTLKGSEVRLKSSLDGFNTTLKGSEISLKSSLDGINTKLESGLEVTSKLSNDKITQLNQKVNDLEQQVVNRQVNKPEVEKIIDSRLQEVTKVNDKQVEIINNKLDITNRKLDKLPDIGTITIAVGGLEIFRQILQKSKSISPCQAPALVPPVAAQARANGAATAVLQTATIAQTTAIQRTVNITKNAVTHASYGLRAAKNAADVAWKATHADKALQMLNTVLLLTNALYIGSNIAETVGDVGSLILSSFGVKDSLGNAIDVNQAINNTIKNWIVSRIGAASYAELEEKIKSGHRGTQSIINLYSRARSMIASTQDIAEQTGVDVSKIGNALRQSGAVEADSYGHMSEQPRKFNKLFTGLERAENGASATAGIIRETTDLFAEAKQFNQDRKEFFDKLNEDKKANDREEEVNQRRIESLPQPTEADKLESENN